MITEEMNQLSQRMTHKRKGAIFYIVLHSIRTSKSLLSILEYHIKHYVNVIYYYYQ